MGFNVLSSKHSLCLLHNSRFKYMYMNIYIYVSSAPKAPRERLFNHKAANDLIESPIQDDDLCVVPCGGHAKPGAV